MTAPTLDGRLLCASRCADWIPLRPEPLYAAGAGFVSEPLTIIAGPRDVDACLIGETSDGVVVAFRGTQTPPDPTASVVLDWLQDFAAAPIRDAALPGLVHWGFAAALNTLLPALVAQLRRTLAGRSLLVTGHSKGASVAMLAAWILQTVYGFALRAITFAGARVGTSAFATAFAAKGIDLVRYEFGIDPVPHLPFGSPRGYHHAGTLRYSTDGATIVGASAELALRRLLGLELAMATSQYARLAADHGIASGSGYQRMAAVET